MPHRAKTSGPPLERATPSEGGEEDVHPQGHVATSCLETGELRAFLPFFLEPSFSFLGWYDVRFRGSGDSMTVIPPPDESYVTFGSDFIVA